MSSTPKFVTLSVLACLLAAGPSLVGCSSGADQGAIASNPRGFDGDASAAMITEYQAGRFSIAYRAATTAASRTTGPERERAILIAGLSAQALNQHDDAEQWLRQIERSADAEIAGRAKAGLGLLAMNRGDHARAAAMLTSAATQLKGDEAARASLFAGQSYEAMNRPERARTQYMIAQGVAQSPSLKSTITGQLASIGQHGYTVQLGAFASMENARIAVSRFSGQSQSAGMGTPRIVERKGIGGRPLYIVQAGSFRTQQEADTARAALGAATARSSFVAPAFASANE
ncbi:MAG: SPOR domain-containing protein [Phycisphaeraceae bacterium]|nr:SPOR domain-containing protein [Phycisphaeraceae bacterium]